MIGLQANHHIQTHTCQLAHEPGAMRPDDNGQLLNPWKQATGTCENERFPLIQTGQQFLSLALWIKSAPPAGRKQQASNSR